jgi:hypothetical protein
MKIDHENKTISVRQSWLGTLMVCPQRANLSIKYPDMSSGSHATAIGTGVHSAIERTLCTIDYSEDIDLLDMQQYAIKEVMEELNRLKDPPAPQEEYEPAVFAMVEAWVTKIAPSVQFGGLVENFFQVPLYTVALNGYDILLEGTIDYVEPDGRVWDWKTSGRTYHAKEKQERSHQSTAYCYAVKNMKLSAEPRQFFNFGVMIRQDTPKAQIVETTRWEGDYEWLRKMATSAVNSALVWTGDWPMNDQSALCSHQWCDYWSICKGSHVASW